jgi:hypothetical protein
MSDPAHLRRQEEIARVLAALGDFWRTHPELRLGQIVLGLAGDRAAFYLDDSAWEKLLCQGHFPEAGSSTTAEKL